MPRILESKMLEDMQEWIADLVPDLFVDEYNKLMDKNLTVDDVIWDGDN